MRACGRSLVERYVGKAPCLACQRKGRVVPGLQGVVQAQVEPGTQLRLNPLASQSGIIQLFWWCST